MRVENRNDALLLACCKIGVETGESLGIFDVDEVKIERSHMQALA